MKCSASLLGLKVRDYFSLCNWQLLPPPSKNYLPKQAKITAPDCPIVLSTLTVKEFLIPVIGSYYRKTNQPPKSSCHHYPQVLPVTYLA